jgi:hypothetical protein
MSTGTPTFDAAWAKKSTAKVAYMRLPRGSDVTPHASRALVFIFASILAGCGGSSAGSDIYHSATCAQLEGHSSLAQAFIKAVDARVLAYDGGSLPSDVLPFTERNLFNSTANDAASFCIEQSKLGQARQADIGPDIAGQVYNDFTDAGDNPSNFK